MLGQRLRVVVRDGRVLVGQLSCLDKQGNIILSHTVQVLAGCSAGAEQKLKRHPEERLIGLVLVPPQQRVSCEVEVGTSVGAVC
ncbi:hypothetical protein WJX81_005167 [Elliptochloris bilobata]|uniref:Sm domain-containing protein n=1 Tax=Elliptochloris bilobata TaxID=381761 RepID=A0AAW1SJ27_9CHLO